MCADSSFRRGLIRRRSERHSPLAGGIPAILDGAPLGPSDTITTIEVIDMIHEATAMKVRQNLGELLNEVQYRNGRVVITKAGKPVAAIVDIDLFERIRRLDEEFATLTREIGDAFAGVPPEEGAKLVDQAVKAARRKARRR